MKQTDFWTTKLPLLVFIFISLFWLQLTIRSIHDIPLPAIGDFQQHLSQTYHLMAGDFWQDPNYQEEPAWYPPLFPLLLGVLAKILGQFPAHTYVASHYWITFWTIPAFFIAGWMLFRNPWIGVVVLTAFLFVLPWMSLHMAMITHPIVLALGLAALALVFSARAVEGSWKWAMGTGLLLGLLIQSENPFAICTSLGITAGFAWLAVEQICQKKQVLPLVRRFLLMVLVAFLTAGWYLGPLIWRTRLKVLNQGGMFAQQYLEMVDFAFMGYGWQKPISLFFIFTGLSFLTIRRRPGDRMIVANFSLVVLFELLSYWRIYRGELGLPPAEFIPIFVPDRFQFSRTFSGVFLFGAGAWYWLKKLGKLFDNEKKMTALLMLGLTVFLFGINFNRFLKRAEERRNWLISGQMLPAGVKMAAFIRENTQLTDVILSDHDSVYAYVVGLTGRGVVATNDCHANPFVDHAQRREDHWTMLKTNSEEKFWHLAKKYRVTYALVTPTTRAYLPDLPFMKFIKNKPVFSEGGFELYSLKQKTKD